MTQTPTDALRLVPVETLRRCAAVLADPKAEHSHDVSYLIEEVEALAAAPASPLPGGGDEKSEDERFIREYPEAVRKGDWERIARLLSGRLRQMDKRSKAANARADALIAELKEARSTVEELLYAHTEKGIAMGEAFLARNGKGEGQ